MSNYVAPRLQSGRTIARSCCDDCTCAGCPDCVSGVRSSALARFRRRRRRPRVSIAQVRAPRGLGDFSDDLIDWARSTFETGSCLAQANQQAAPLDARVAQLAATWNPTGYYTPADITSVVSQTISLLQDAITTVSNAPRSASDSEQMIKEALDHLFQKSQAGLAYIQTANTARANGVELVQADDLKQWVLNCMNEASSAFVTASVNECLMPWLAEVIAQYQAKFDVFAGYVSGVAGAIWDGIKAVARAPAVVAGLLDKVIKVSLIGAGAYLAYLLFFDKRKK